MLQGLSPLSFAWDLPKQGQNLFQRPQALTDELDQQIRWEVARQPPDGGGQKRTPDLPADVPAGLGRGVFSHLVEVRQIAGIAFLVLFASLGPGNAQDHQGGHHLGPVSARQMPDQMPAGVVITDQAGPVPVTLCAPPRVVCQVLALPHKRCSSTAQAAYSE